MRTDEDDIETIEGSLPRHTYYREPFLLNANDPDSGYGRYVVRVYDEPTRDVIVTMDDEEEVLYHSDQGKVEVKLKIIREAGHVTQFLLRKVRHNKSGDKELATIMLDRDNARALVKLLRDLDSIAPDKEMPRRVLDDDLIQEYSQDPAFVQKINRINPTLLRQIIEEDVTETDVIAIANRRAAVERFRNLMEDDNFFDVERSHFDGPEGVWEDLFKKHPWLLGVSLSEQLCISWDPDHIQVPVIGRSVKGPGKIPDALMKTVGAFQSLVFVEIKHHQTELLKSGDKAYRPGCWPVSQEVASGITQAQVTVQLAIENMIDKIAWVDTQGRTHDDVSYLFNPRSFLVVGNLGQFRDSNEPYEEKIRSFELFRRSVNTPKIVTFDELLARAEWVVERAAAKEDVDLQYNLDESLTWSAWQEDFDEPPF